MDPKRASAEDLAVEAVEHQKRPKASAEDLAVRQEAGRRLVVDRDRREAIQQWVLVAVLLAVIVVVMAVF